VNGSAAARRVDDLYRRAVEEPGGIDDASLGEWVAEAAELVDATDRSVTRILRRVVRDARKLAVYWASRDASGLPDWRNGIDEALGARGWEPQLDLITAALAADPSPELFEEMRERYRAVHFHPWMEGVRFEEWVEG
jgi:Arc/MetJ family transcription regulator